jgi:putative ABC transport system ATP-binding protein
MPKEVLIKIKNVEKTYSTGEVAVRALLGVSFEIFLGDFLIIVGRNGSGKSTLLRQIGLLDTPDAGEIIINNQNVVKISDKERSEIRLKKIGYVFQDYALMSDLTAIENVMLPAMMLERTADARKMATRLIEKVGLKDRSNNLPNQLSGGEQQKVAIARALVNNPEIIIADEPTANLDLKAAREVIEIFKNLNREGHTIVMVTHEEDEERSASRIIELIDGQILTE